MKKLIIAILFGTLAYVTFASVPVATFTNRNMTVVATPLQIYDYLQKGYSITNEGTLLTDMYNSNYNALKNTVSIASATYTALTVTITSTGSAMKAARDKIKIGSILETKNTSLYQSIVRSINGNTVTVSGWWTAATTSSTVAVPTTSVGFYINEWKDQNPLRYKVLTGTTGATGAAVNIAHGLTGNKIVSITAKVGHIVNGGVTPRMINEAYDFELSHDATYATITLGTTATSISATPATIYVIYQE